MNCQANNEKKYLISFITFFLMLLMSINSFFAQTSNNKFNPKQAVKNIDSVMQKYLYDGSLVQSDSYKNLMNQIISSSKQTSGKKDFIDLFNNSWQKGPFSHVRLAEARQSAEMLADYLDKMNVNGKGAELKWIDDVAILSVYTMMGLNTIDQINKAYDEIVAKKAKALIIDLRKNQGGAFAVKPLIGHLLNKDFAAGMFLSNVWTTNNKGIPDKNYIKNISAWEGWSIKSFWNDAQEQGVLKIVMKPMLPVYDGKVYVLTSKITASAAELAADALKSSGRATLIGETTEGAMLSQKMYDLPQGLQLSLPIADYYSIKSGRIEGNGVQPNIRIKQVFADELSALLIAGENVEDALKKVQEKIESANIEPLGTNQVFLLGSMNDWGKKRNLTPLFKYKGNGIYETSIVLDKGIYEFKIAPADWKFDYGVKPTDKKIFIDKTKSLIKEKGSSNLEINIEEDGSKILFSLDVKDLNKASLKIILQD